MLVDGHVLPAQTGTFLQSQRPFGCKTVPVWQGGLGEGIGVAPYRYRA